MNISESDKNKILKLYYDTNTGYHKNINKYYELLNKSILKKNIKFVIDNIESNQLSQHIQNKRDLLIPIVHNPDSWQIDLTFYNQFSKQNNRYIGLFTAININSRVGYAKPIKSKSKIEMLKVIKDFVNKNIIKSIECDNGMEFVNNDVKNLLSSKNIELITFNKKNSPYATMKIERFNKTIRDKINNYMEANNTNKYIDIIDKLIINYNNTTHSTINQKPKEADQNDIFYDELIKKKVKINQINQIFKIGDHIRLLIKNDIFDKGDKNNFTKEIYKITEFVNTRYKIINIDDQKDQKEVLPFQMKKIDMKNLTKKKETRKNNKIKKDGEKSEYKKSEKSKRFIRKEGI